MTDITTVNTKIALQTVLVNIEIFFNKLQTSPLVIIIIVVIVIHLTFLYLHYCLFK